MKRLRPSDFYRAGRIKIDRETGVVLVEEPNAVPLKGWGSRGECPHVRYFYGGRWPEPQLATALDPRFKVCPRGCGYAVRR